MDLYMILFGNAILVFAVERVVSAFFDKRRTSFPVMVLSYVFIGGALGLPLWWANPIVTTLLLFIALLTATLNYKSTITRRLAVLVGSYLMLNATTIVFHLLAFFAPALSAFIVELDFILATAIAYLVALAMHRYFKNIPASAQNLHKLLIPFLFVPITQLLVVIFMHINLEIAGVIQASSNGLGIAFLFFYLYYSVSKSFEKDIKSALHSQEKEYYFTQCQLMQESVEQVKSIRHDMKLHLATIRDYTANNKANEATDYLDGLLEDIGESEVYSDTGNIVFDSIINFKLKDILSNHINLQIKIFIPPELNIEVSDIVTILGNLLDNAFDAVAKVKDKRIKLDVESSKGSLFIKIDNTFDGEVKYAEVADGTEQVIVSRKGGDNHGYGLSNIRKSVEKYDGHMDVSHEGNVFSVGILMYVDGK